MDPGPFLYIDTSTTSSVYFLQLLFFYFTANITFHLIRLILCFQQTGEIDNLTASWGEIFWLCCAGSTLLMTPVARRPTTSQPTTPSEATLFSYWSIKPWFLTEGNLAAVLSTPSS